LRVRAQETTSSDALDADAGVREKGPHSGPWEHPEMFSWLWTMFPDSAQNKPSDEQPGQQDKLASDLVYCVSPDLTPVEQAARTHSR